MARIPNTRASLIVRIRDPRDEQAWSEFLEIYEPLVYRLARSKGFQDADAAELTQEVFLAVSSAVERWDPDPARGKFRNWLFRIARNLMINLLAKQRRHPQGSGKTQIRELLEAQPAPNGEDSALFEHQYKREAFRWAAERVRLDFRDSTWQAFWQTAVEEQPCADVAQRLGMSVGAVYIARSRVMARLRQKIERLEGTLPNEAP
jgi:RNA polymerase sigma-70 factor (ECF subfamily)